MILYNPKKAWATVFSSPGPYLPNAFQVAFPAGVLALIWGYIYQSEIVGSKVDFGDVTGITNGYTTVLGFLVVFRAQLAYSRFWDGASYLQSIKSGWFNAATSIFAFCTRDEEKQEDVQRFQHGLVRLMSLMYAAALQLVAGADADTDLKVLDYDGLDHKFLKWALMQHDKLEIIMFWLQRFVVEAHRTDVIDISPPILSRVFQEFSNGMIEVSNAKRINKFPFPFPYAQMIWIMLFAHWLLTIFMSGIARSPPVAFCYTFSTVFALWGITWIAIEIEMPFGTDKNDLPMVAMQKSMNDCLVLLLHPNCQTVPRMCPIETQHLNIGVRGLRESGGGLKRIDTVDYDQRISGRDETGEVRYFLGDTIAGRMESIKDTLEKQITELKEIADPRLMKQDDDIAPLKEIVRTLDAPLKEIVRALEKHFEALVQVQNNSKAFGEDLKSLRRNIERSETEFASRSDHVDRVCSGNLLGVCTKGSLLRQDYSASTAGLRVA